MMKKSAEDDVHREKSRQFESRQDLRSTLIRYDIPSFNYVCKYVTRENRFRIHTKDAIVVQRYCRFVDQGQCYISLRGGRYGWAILAPSMR